MNAEIIEKATRKLVLDREELSEKGNCRDSVILLALALRKIFPEIGINYLVYPEAKEGDGVHYSLLLSSDNWKLLVNIVSSPGFPKYIGDPLNAVPTFQAMNMVEKVI